ncbi:hypothetical protein [Lysobacter sp. HA35]
MKTLTMPPVDTTPAVERARREFEAALAANRDHLERLAREIGDDVIPEHSERNPE